MDLKHKEDVPMDKQELLNKIDKVNRKVENCLSEMDIDRIYVHIRQTDGMCKRNNKFLEEIMFSQSEECYKLCRTDETPLNFDYEGDYYYSPESLAEERYWDLYVKSLLVLRALKKTKTMGIKEGMKFLKSWSYAVIVLDNNNNFAYHNFVQDKYEERNSRPYKWDGFYYNPMLGDKVLEFFELGFSDTYCRRCRYCGQFKNIAYSEEGFVKVGDDYYCQDCVKEYNFGKCEVSGEMYFRWKLEFSNKKDEKQVLKVLGKKAKTGMLVSRRYLERNHICRCNRCGKLYSYKGMGCCSDCSKGVVRDYGEKNYVELRCRNEHTKTHYGFELETELKNGYDRYEAVYNINDQIGDLIKIKSDASLNTGFEIVSHILTYKKFCSIKNRFNKAFKDAINDGCYSKRAESTGLHIHISRAGFKDANHLARFCQAWYVDKEFTRYVAQRDFGQYREWNSTIASNKEYFKQFLNGDLNKYNTYHSARYNIVNLNNQNTVEIRIFKGILSIDFVSYAIELCELIKNYTEEHEQIKRMEMIKYIIKNATRKLKDFVKFYLIMDKVAIKEVA